MKVIGRNHRPALERILAYRRFEAIARPSMKSLLFFIIEKNIPAPKGQAAAH